MKEETISPHLSTISSLNSLVTLVAQGEGLHLEFKEKATFPEKVVREMVAFANTQGGRLLIGISDDGKVNGVKYPEEESHVIHEALKKCKPTFTCLETFIPITAKRSVICYTIPESNRKPHYLQTDRKEVFIRSADQSLKASSEMKEIIKRSQTKKDIRFTYGEHEDFLMKYLDEHPFITLKEFMTLRKKNRFYSSRKFVLLVLANVLTITPHENGDRYSLAFQ